MKLDRRFINSLLVGISLGSVIYFVLVFNFWATAVKARQTSFIDLGSNYTAELGKAYAAAWDEGVQRLEAGETVTSAYDAVGRTWCQKRIELYDRHLTSRFASIVSASVRDVDVTLAERAAMVAAWRELSLGLKK